MTMSKTIDCPVCGESNIYNIFLHMYVSNEYHGDILNPILKYVIDNAENKFAFEIADDIVNKKAITFAGLDEVSLDIDTLTSIISRYIVLIGYNRRKCIAMPRKVQNNAIINIDPNYDYEYLLKNIVRPSIPRKVKNVTPDKFITEQRTKFINTHKVTITKLFRFASGHHLPNHPRLCQYSHGHEWLLEVSVYDKANVDTSMVLDFSDLKKIVNKHIIDVLDHNYVNDILWNPTAENLCAWIFEELYSNGLLTISKIKLWEAVDSYAELTRDDFFRTTSIVLTPKTTI